MRQRLHRTHADQTRQRRYDLMPRLCRQPIAEPKRTELGIAFAADGDNDPFRRVAGNPFQYTVFDDKLLGLRSGDDPDVQPFAIIQQRAKHIPGAPACRKHMESVGNLGLNPAQFEPFAQSRRRQQLQRPANMKAIDGRTPRQAFAVDTFGQIARPAAAARIWLPDGTNVRGQ